MKRTTRRLLSLLMAVVLCLGLTPVTAWAANFPSNFYAHLMGISGMGTVSSSLTYTSKNSEAQQVYGMEYAGGAFFTVVGNKDDDGWRELRMYNSDLTSYRTIGEVTNQNDTVQYAIVDTAMDLSGDAPVLYGTYNGYALVGGKPVYCSSICQISLTDGKTSNWQTVTGIPETDIIYAIAFDKEGTLYGIGADMGDDGGPASLYTIDLDTGAATLVGAIMTGSGSAVSTNYLQDLAFDHAQNTLYWAENAENDLYTLNTTDAVATKVGQVKSSGKVYPIQSFCIPYDTAFGQADDQYMISVICEGAGEVTCNDENKPFYLVNSGEDITLTIEFNTGGVDDNLLGVTVDGKTVSISSLVDNSYTFENVTGNHVIEVKLKKEIPATQKTVTWFHYQGEPASFYTVDNVYKFYDLPYLDKEVPREDYVQTLLDEEGKPIDDDEIILPGSYDVHVTHPGNADYAAMDVIYTDALVLGKCPGTPGRPVVYGKVGCKQGDLTTISALQDYYGTNGELIDAAYDEIPVTLVWQEPDKIYDQAGYFSAKADIYAAELSERILACYNDDEGNPLYEGKQISFRDTQVIVLPADQASLIKLAVEGDEGSGTVSGKGVYKNGTEVTVTATANTNAGYVFQGWQDEDGQTISDADATYTFTANGDCTLTAVFVSDPEYLVKLEADPADGGTVTGGGNYKDEGHRATVSAEANEGYYFMGWYAAGSDEAVNTSTEYSFVVLENGITLTAKFGIDYLARAEQAKETFASAVNNNTLSWAILEQAVEAYKEADNFMKDPPSVIQDAYERYAELTTYYNGIEKLDLSNQNLGSADLEKLDFFTSLTELNLSGTSLTDLTGLNSLAATLKTLNLSNNKGVSDLSALKSLTALETLDISNTGVTTLDSLVPEGDSSFPGYQNLTAKNLTLNSVSALEQLIGAEGFAAGSVNKWDFTGSTLPDTEGSKTDVKAIQTALGDKFTPPTIRTTPAPAPTPAEHAIVVAETEHGKVTAEPAKAAEGATVVLTVSPEEGYELRSIEAVGADGAAVELAENADGTFSFTMPAGNVTVAATFGCDGGELCPSHGFADVDQGQWYHEAIDWAVSNKVLNGFDDTGLMMPDADLTRAQMAQILWNVEGNPVVDYPVAFGDAREGDWFYRAVAWAASEGIFEGYDDGSGLFGPDDALTREQAAAVLMRWTAANGGDTSARADLSSYPDADEVSEWASEYMSWAVAVGIVSGVEQADGTLLLDPTGTSSRAVAATLMMRLIG